MSYIVKSEKFPESCNECDACYMCPGIRYCSLSHQADGKHLDVKDYFYNNTKHPDCPLISLSGIYGKLIHADELIARIENDDAFYEYGVSEDFKHGLLRAVGHIIEMDAIVELD